jgi:hypothetical protein
MWISNHSIVDKRVAGQSEDVVAKLSTAPTRRIFWNAEPRKEESNGAEGTKAAARAATSKLSCAQEQEKSRRANHLRTVAAVDNL